MHDERELRLHHLAIWRESTLFAPRERAALVWIEVPPSPPGRGVSDDIYESVRTQFSEKELSDPTFEVMAINGWTRANIAFRTVPGSADKDTMLEHWASSLEDIRRSFGHPEWFDIRSREIGFVARYVHRYRQGANEIAGRGNEALPPSKRSPDEELSGAKWGVPTPSFARSISACQKKRTKHLCLDFAMSGDMATQYEDCPVR